MALLSSGGRYEICLSVVEDNDTPMRNDNDNFEWRSRLTSFLLLLDNKNKMVLFFREQVINLWFGINPHRVCIIILLRRNNLYMHNKEQQQRG